MANVYGAQGVSPTLRGLATNVFELEAGQVSLIPSGTWKLALGRYLKAQEYDPITTIWRDIGDDGAGDVYLQSDGANHRVANQTGCAIGAIIGNPGSGYTATPTVTPSAGGSIWTAVVGGAISTTVTVGSGGANYLYPPQVIISAPASPGVQATAYATLTSGAVSSITVTDQGAGYTAPPLVSFLNDPRDTAGAGATATTVLTGAGTITALLVTDHGTPLTAVPTLTLSGGGGTGVTTTVLMCWSITGVIVGVAGSGYTQQAGYAEIRGLFGSYTSTTGYTNPQTQLGLTRYRPSKIFLPTGAAGTFTAGTVTSSTNIVDGGIYAAPLQGYAILGNGVVATAASLSFTMGGQNDSFRLLAV
jgi:hypothetical protein